MQDILDIAGSLAVKAEQLDMEITADGRVSDRDMATLLGYSARRARELREAGEGWPRYRASVDGCTWSASFVDAAEWLADRRENPT
jgi:hypothetical protein